MLRRRTWIIAAAAALALTPSVALAHGGAAVSGRFPDALAEWSLAPVGFVTVAVLVGLYGWGYVRLRRCAPTFHFPAWHVAAFGAGALLLLLVEVSPINNYGDDLFWVHMVQHMVMVMVVVPLLLLGAPATLALRSASTRVRRTYFIPLLESRALRVLTYPPVALVLFVVAISVWHVPGAYQAAVRNEVVHGVEHGSFVVTAALFWWLIVAVDATRLRPAHIGRIALLIAAVLQTIALALILSGTEDPLYAIYVDVARDWGPSALTDQRIGAGVMWVPGTMMFFLAILTTVYYWAEHEHFKGRRGDLVRDLAKRHA